MSFEKPLNYDASTGRWSLELYKAPKDVLAQCGLKISVDPGYPTGERGAFYQTKEPQGVTGGSIEFRAFDNLAGWTSAVVFDLATFMEKLIEMMPKDKVKCETFLLSERDLEYIKTHKKNEEDE